MLKKMRSYKPYAEIKPSKYQFTERPNGFDILNTQTNIKVTIDLENNEHNIRFITRSEGEKVGWSAGLLDAHDIIGNIANKFNEKFDERHGINPNDYTLTKQQRGKNHGCNKWATKKTGMAIAKRVALQLNRLKAAIPEIVQIHKIVFNAIGPKNYKDACSKYLNEKSFWDKNQYFIKDLRNYKAAAIMFFEKSWSVLDFSKWINKYLPTEIKYTKKDNKEVTTRYVDNWIEITDWDDGYNKSEKAICKPYPALMKTLLKVKPFALRRVSKVLTCGKIEKTFENFFEFKCFILGMEHHRGREHRKTLEFSTAEQFKKAIRIVDRFLHTKTDMRKSTEIYNALSFILDAPVEGDCKILGLAQRSIEWHRNEQAMKLKLDEEKRLKLCKLPPIELPKSTRETTIEFLKTVGEIIDEGSNNGHCLGSYWQRAVDGKCYLFRIKKGNHIANAEVTREGRLNQIHGPGNRNKDNDAVRLGKIHLNNWCEKLREYLWGKIKENPLEIRPRNDREDARELAVCGPAVEDYYEEEMPF